MQFVAGDEKLTKLTKKPKFSTFLKTYYAGVLSACIFEKLMKKGPNKFALKTGIE